MATDAAGWLDRAALDGFAGLLGPRTGPLAQGIVHLADPALFLLFATGLVVVALVRVRPRLALAVALILLGANVTTQLLKPALAEPRFADLLGGAAGRSGVVAQRALDRGDVAGAVRDPRRTAARLRPASWPRSVPPTPSASATA